LKHNSLKVFVHSLRKLSLHLFQVLLEGLENKLRLLEKNFAFLLALVLEEFDPFIPSESNVPFEVGGV